MNIRKGNSAIDKGLGLVGNDVDIFRNTKVDGEDGAYVNIFLNRGLMDRHLKNPIDAGLGINGINPDATRTNPTRHEFNFWSQSESGGGRESLLLLQFYSPKDEGKALYEKTMKRIFPDEIEIKNLRD